MAIWAIQLKDGSFVSYASGVPVLFSLKREAEDYSTRSMYCWTDARVVKVQVLLVPGQPNAIYDGRFNTVLKPEQAVRTP